MKQPHSGSAVMFAAPSVPDDRRLGKISLNMAKSPVAAADQMRGSAVQTQFNLRTVI